MKICPACKRSYDLQKSFCVYDGQSLLELRAEDSLIDRVIDHKYSIDYKIADGSAGTVYRATHLQLQTLVAIKILHSAFSDDAAAIERFRREAYAAMRVRHPNAVAVLDFGVTSDRLVYVVMELLIGQSLADRLKARGSFSPVETEEILRQACAALSVAHARGIVHRDLKPENIFLHQEDGREIVKVLDFGIAKVQEVSLIDQSGSNLTKGAVVGTPYYIAPEQCSGQPVDARADVYSLGIILYQMLAGTVPFDGPSAIIVLLKQLNEKPAPIHKAKPGLHPLLNGVAAHALEKDPRSRPQTVMSFAEELSAAVRAVTDVEFKDVFRYATESELEAALLLADENRSPKTAEYSRPRLASADAPIKDERKSASLSKRVCGRLSWFDLSTIVFMLSGLKESGLLTLHNLDLAPGGDDEIERIAPYACLFFDEGRITRALLGVRIGIEAFYQLFQMPLEGCFQFKRRSMPPELAAADAISEPVGPLIEEALNLKTLVDRYHLKFPDMLTAFDRRSPKLEWEETETASLAEAVWNMLDRPGIMLIEILARSPCCNAKTYGVLAALLADGQVAAVRSPSIDEGAMNAEEINEKEL